MFKFLRGKMIEYDFFPTNPFPNIYLVRIFYGGKVSGLLKAQFVFHRQRLEELNHLERGLVGGDTSFLLHTVGTRSEPSVRFIISTVI